MSLPKTFALWVVLVAAVATCLNHSPVEAAPPTPVQRRELAAIRTDVGKVRGLIARKKTDEAQQVLIDAEDRLKKVREEAELTEMDSAVIPVLKAIELQKGLLAKATGQGGDEKEVASFVEDVAPILTAKCVSCHDNNARGGLRLNTFAGLERGGSSGRLLVPGNPQASLIGQRLTAANPQFRMPRGGAPLTPAELQTIAAWIAAGAVFDGDDKEAALGSLRKKSNQPAPVVAKPTGNETVSFTKDIAPTLLNTCGGCHNDQQRRGGLSVMNFEKLLRGGESGQVLVAGKLDESRLWRLVNGDETPVMPAGNMAGITRKFYNDLQTWIKEGIKYDGPDAKTPLRDLVPTEAQMRAEELAKLSPEEWLTKRLEDSTDMWNRSFRGTEMQKAETEDFVVFGDISPARLQAATKFAQEQMTRLKTAFDLKETPVFKGKLALFVVKDRFAYDEFNSTIHKREVPREIHGHSSVTAGQDQALVVVYDVGDEPTADLPGLQLLISEHVTGAVLQRSGQNLPTWLVQGAGLALAQASGSASGNPYLAQLSTHAAQILRESTLTRPSQILQDGTFAPGDVAPMGFALVQFLLKQGGPANFGQLVRRLQTGDSLDAALRAVYRLDSQGVGQAFAVALASVGGKK